MRRTVLTILCAATLFAAPADILIQADKDFDKATAARGAEGFLSFFDGDATILPKSGAPVSGKAVLAAVFKETWAQPGYSLRWTPLKAVMAASGELGYTYGTYERKRLREGKPTVETGKYVTVWKRQPDGKWKVVLDMGN
jgi:ketosteroid isomerase-like protein